MSYWLDLVPSKALKKLTYYLLNKFLNVQYQVASNDLLKTDRVIAQKNSEIKYWTVNDRGGPNSSFVVLPVTPEVAIKFVVLHGMPLFFSVVPDSTWNFN